MSLTIVSDFLVIFHQFLNLIIGIDSLLFQYDMKILRFFFIFFLIKKYKFMNQNDTRNFKMKIFQ